VVIVLLRIVRINVVVLVVKRQPPLVRRVTELGPVDGFAAGVVLM
jgi:hypothetical protein